MRVTPAEIMVAPGGAMQFQLYSVDGSATDADSWQATGGTVTPDGLFTAAMVEGDYSVTATKGSSQAVAGVEVSNFNPHSDIPDLYAWNEVDLMGLANNAPIGEVTDATGLGHSLLQDQNDDWRPLNKTNVLNGKAVAESDGIDDWMRASAVPYGARTTVVIARLKNRTALGTDGIQNVFIHSNGYFRIQPVDEGWIAYTYGDGNSVAFSPRYSNLDWTMFLVRVNSADSVEVSVNDSGWKELNPTDEVWASEDAQRAELFRHHTGDEARAQSPGYFHVARGITNTEARKIRRWFNAYHRYDLA